MSGREEMREVVLVGGGHAHIQVLEALVEEPLQGARVTVVVDTLIAVYSGMVPGFVAGQYDSTELQIDVTPLAARAGADLIVARVVGVDPRERLLQLQDGSTLPYDLTSFDIGSTVAGLEVPGVREHALHTRPIGRFVEETHQWISTPRGEINSKEPSKPRRVLVVGGGAGGVELAFCLQSRLACPEVTLLQRGDRILPGYPASLRSRTLRRAALRGIEVLCGRSVESVEPGQANLQTGETLAYDLLVWVVGAVSHGDFDATRLATDSRGFLSIRSTLQVEAFDDLFAVGDCATLSEYPETPKAGVYAVRQGPVLTANLRAALEGRPLQRYIPQKDFLMLLNLGDGTALGTKWGLSFEGRWVMRLKDSIDRAFMRRFQE